MVCVLFRSLNSNSILLRSVLPSFFYRSITLISATQSHFTGYHYLLRIRTSGIAAVSHLECFLTLSLSSLDEKTRSALSVRRSRIYSIAISSVALTAFAAGLLVLALLLLFAFCLVTLVHPTPSSTALFPISGLPASWLPRTQTLTTERGEHRWAGTTVGIPPMARHSSDVANRT
jgi:hypothetical protein